MSQDKFVNVTDNRISDWQLINWKEVEEDVQNLRFRIFEARREGRMKDLKNLQKLMLRLRANWLLAIRRVTQINKGRRTPGVDREVITTPQERIKLFYWLQTQTINQWNPPPTRRVEIPKAPGKTRPLGIPTIRDRIIQAIVKNALEPEWEAIFEASSYGFRPGRSAHDAMESIWNTYSGPGGNQRDWILDADIKGAFDNISHDYLLEKLGYFPAKPLIQKWLKAGVMIGLDLSPTPAGTPQGGIISPLLANIALHGMEEALGITRGDRSRVIGPYKLVRYADDFVVQCYSKEDAELAQNKLQVWLSLAGLQMSVEKTKIINVWGGFDFLGFTVRKSKTGRKARGYSVFLKPSKTSKEKFRSKVKDIFKRGLHKSPNLLLSELNPLIVGWGNYFRHAVSYKDFSTLDDFLWHRTWRYAKRRHPNKSSKWRKQKYYTTRRKDKWVFYDADSKVTIRKMARLGIRRHILVRGTASPDDPNLVDYWRARRKRPQGQTDQQNRLWTRQNGLCSHCEQWLGGTEELHVHHKDGNRNDNRLVNLLLLHETCHHQITVANVRQRKGA